MKKNRITPRMGIWTGLLVIAVIAMAATLSMAKPELSRPQTDDAQTLAAYNLSKALLEVSNMSCGGCVDTITKSLASLPGVGEVSVDVAAGKAEVAFDPEVLEDHQQIARTITAAGYPAKISAIYTAQEVRQQAQQAALRAQTHIASVGREEISRKDYAIELQHARKRYEKAYGQDVFTTDQGRQLLQRLKSQIAYSLIDEGIKLQEVARAGYTVAEGDIDQAFQAYLKDRDTTLDQLKAELAANDFPFSYFHTKFTQGVRLRQYLEEKVIGDSVDDDARQRQYSNWLANARLLAKVTYYDKELEKLVKAGSGGSCGGSGAGGCSGAK